MRHFFILIALLLLAAPAKAQYVDYEDNVAPPPSLPELQNITRENKPTEEDPLPFDIRNDAMREAALSYGARGGLAWRTYHIRDELESRASYMDKVFDFRQLLVPAPSGLLIEPPIISEALDAMIIDAGGLEAAVADKVYNIGRNARIVTAPRTWRFYLERQWGEVSPPPDILRPSTREEREKWHEWVKEGWDEGVSQANEIFQTDLNKLVSDYEGMIRYRMLLAQGMVSPPNAMQVYRGVTGGGDEMRVGDRGLAITGLSELKPGYQEWQPVNR